MPRSVVVLSQRPGSWFCGLRGAVDDMGTRIDELEKCISDLLEQAQVSDSTATVDAGKAVVGTG